MKTAILCNGLSERKTDRAELVQQLRAISHSVYIGGRMGDYIDSYYSDDTAEFLPLDASRANTNPIIELAAIRNNQKILEKASVDNVIIYGVKNHPSMAIAASLAGVSKILCVVNGSGNLFRIGGMKGRLLRFMSFPMLRIAYSKSVAVCFQNEDDRELFLKEKLISRKTNTFITGGSGVNLSLFPQSPMPAESRFLFLSRIAPMKGLGEYIRAAKIIKEKYPDAQFDIVGPFYGQISEEVIQELKESEKSGIVKYHGATSDVSGWMTKCRFFIYPSYYPEGVPRCALQALSTGRPIITCNTPGCKETVVDGYNGFLVEPRNVEALAAKMEEFIDHPETVEQMGKNSRQLAEEKFDVEKINETLIKYIV